MPKLAKIDQVGYHYFHVFKNESGQIQAETTAKDYFQLGIATPVNPIPPQGYVWWYSYEDVKFNTPNGKLPDETYGEVASRNGHPSYKIVKLTGKIQCSVSNEDIVANELTIDGLAKVEKISASQII